MVDFSTNAMAFGCSPLVLPFGRAFSTPGISGADTYAGGMFLYVYFIRFGVSALWGFVLLDAALSRHPEHGGYHMFALAFWPAGLTLLGWALQQKSVLFVMLAAVMMGVGHGPAKYNGQVLLPSWWAVDDRVRYGQSLLGFFRGLGAILWTLFFGGLTSYLGEERVYMTLYVTAFLQACLLFSSVAPILSQAEFHKIPKMKVAAFTSGESTQQSDQATRLLKDWRFYAIIVISTSISFTGLGIKQLLAVLYQEGVQLEYSTSSHYAAASLLLFWLLMTLSPFLGTQKLLLPGYAVVLALEAVVYGLSSVAVDMRKASWLLGCRVLSGGLLAVMMINKTVLYVEVLGKDRLKKMKSLQAPFDVLGGAGAPVAWVTSSSC